MKIARDAPAKAEWAAPATRKEAFLNIVREPATDAFNEMQREAIKALIIISSMIITV